MPNEALQQPVKQPDQSLIQQFEDPQLRKNFRPKDAEVANLHQHYKEKYKGLKFDFATPDGCRDEIKQVKSWHNLTDKYALNFPWAMYRLIVYRKQYIDGLLQDCAKPTSLVAKSVGSTDLTSDYDLTIAAENGKDVEILRRFNQKVKQDFGAQPGTVFDTNVYLKDYAQVQGNIQFSEVTPYQDKEVEPQPGDWVFSHGDQDIAALVKQRRFSTWTEWTAFTDAVCKDLPKELQPLVRQQYDLADTIFNLGVADLLQSIEAYFRQQPDSNLNSIESALYKQIDEALGSLVVLYKRFDKEPFNQQVSLTSLKELWSLAIQKPVPATIKAKSSNLLAEMQVKNEMLLSVIRSKYEDLVLECSNTLYADVMEKVRKIQQGAISPGARAAAQYEIGRAIFFASEAYHTEGAVMDIVLGSQGSEAEKQKAREKILPIHLLESFNEQYGDFLKDVKHYTHLGVAPGKVFYRCSKYLNRLFGAMAEINKKLNGTGEATLPKPKYPGLYQLNESYKDFVAPINDLVKIRKGEYALKTNETSDSKAATLLKPLKIETVSQLESQITSLAQKFNVEVRKVLGETFYADSQKSQLFIIAYGNVIRKSNAR